MCGSRALLAGSVGIWLFYVQHQFEDAYWDERRELELCRRRAAGELLPEAARPCCASVTGNIGYHHVHHLDARIPNYNLKRAHDQNAILHSVPTLGLRDGLEAVRLEALG